MIAAGNVRQGMGSSFGRAGCGSWRAASFEGWNASLPAGGSGAPRNRPLGGVCDGPRSGSGLSTPSATGGYLLSIAFIHRGVLTQFLPPVTVTRAAGCRER